MALYLDYNASAPVSEEVLETMIDVYRNQAGNPDSRTHTFGMNARQAVENARKQTAALLGVSPAEIIFTSGATESNNMVLKGLMDFAQESGKKHIISSSIEHKSILETLKYLEQKGFEIELVDPDETGRVDPGKINSRLREDTLLVALMHVNNETGTIQPVAEIGKILKEQDIYFLIDATQSVGKLGDELRNLDYDFLTFSAHKLQGPQGIGALVMRRKNYSFPPLKPLHHGGGQESGWRSGTVPTALTAGLGKACQIAFENEARNTENLLQRRSLLLKMLQESGLKYQINGDETACIPNSLNVSFHGVSSEGLMILLKGICAISNGSACTASQYSLSYVLKAMGLPKDRIEEAIRISWGPDTDLEEFKGAIKQLIELVRQLQ